MSEPEGTVCETMLDLALRDLYELERAERMEKIRHSIPYCRSTAERRNKIRYVRAAKIRV